ARTLSQPRQHQLLQPRVELAFLGFEVRVPPFAAGPRGPGHGRSEVAGGPVDPSAGTAPPSPAAHAQPASASPDPRLTDSDARPETANGHGHGLELLPLGSGLVLIGLGLGLAFLALRLRRI
ncbi:hypothetical protein ACWEGQ_09420, partial [Streptomyces seoulensis]